MKLRGYRGGPQGAGPNGGSLERNAQMMMMGPSGPGGGQVMAGGGGGSMNRGGSLERNSGYSYNYYKSQLKQPDTEPFQEEIYDFGGANVKSCASIALKKSMAKGMIPPDYGYAHPMPPPPYSATPPPAGSMPYHHQGMGQPAPAYGMRSAQPPPPPTRQWPPNGGAGTSQGQMIRPAAAVAAGMQSHIAQAQQCMSIQGAPLSLVQQQQPAGMMMTQQFMSQGPSGQGGGMAGIEQQQQQQQHITQVEIALEEFSSGFFVEIIIL